MVLPIVQVGDPVLRAEAAPVADITKLAELIAEMRDTMRAAPGVGLAAPQIGQSLQLAVIEDTVEDAARERTPVPFHVIANPTLTLVGDEMVEHYEGCLSFAGFVMKVKRARRVRVVAIDETGASRVIEATGWYARILQHEIDHLRGIVCCDRMDARTLATAENHGRFAR